MSARTYARRGGRMTKAQRRALEGGSWLLSPPSFYPRAADDKSGAAAFSLAEEGEHLRRWFAGAGGWAAAFGRAAPLAVEAGIGNGAALAAAAAARRAWNWAGFEVYPPGVGAAANALAAADAKNARVVRADFCAALPAMFADGEIGAVNVFFPDPWPKKKHGKRRMLNPDFCKMLARKMSPAAPLHLATDDANYAEFAAASLAAAGFLPRGSDRRGRIVTKYEAAARAAGRAVVDLIWQNGG